MLLHRWVGCAAFAAWCQAADAQIPPARLLQGSVICRRVTAGVEGVICPPGNCLTACQRSTLLGTGYIFIRVKKITLASFCSYFLEPNVHIVNSKLLPWSLSLNLCENIIWIIPHIKHLQNANFNEIRPSSLAAPETKLVIRDLGWDLCKLKLVQNLYHQAQVEQNTC